MVSMQHQLAQLKEAIRQQGESIEELQKSTDELQKSTEELNVGVQNNTNRIINLEAAVAVILFFERPAVCDMQDGQQSRSTLMTHFQEVSRN